MYSGETPSDAALRITRQIAALVLCLLLVCGGFWAKGTVWDIWTDRDIEDVQKSTYYSAAANSAQLRLDQNLPIGYDAAQAVCISLGQPISSPAIPAKADDKDTLIFPADLTGSMETALGSQKLRLETGLTNTDLFKEIYKSLKKKKPVIALMLVADAESAKLQYGVVTGLDVRNNRVTVALSEGVDTYTLAEFVAATRFENTKNIPLRLRFSLLFGTLSRNTAIFFKMSGLKITLPRRARSSSPAYTKTVLRPTPSAGACRDSLLHKTPHDWDITTAANPEKNHRAFFRHSVLETGLKHGTVTLLIDHEPYEVTTFRVDGNYTDGRHPDSVAFTTDIRDDLARRDLTINAMAYSPATGIIDPFGGQEDLKNEIICCVGDPHKRFRKMRYA